MAGSDELVAGGPTFGFCALCREQVPEAGRPAEEFSAGGKFEALGDRFLGLLHERKGRGTDVRVGRVQGARTAR